MTCAVLVWGVLLFHGASAGRLGRKGQESSEVVESHGDARGFHGSPSVVSLRNSDGDHYCSGTIIAPKLVLTAAQCVFEVESPIVAMPPFTEMKSAGVGFEFREALKVLIHPRFDSISNDYDVALVVLAGVLDHPAVNLAISETCFDGTGGKCDLHHFRWVRTSSLDRNAGELVKATTTSIYRNVCKTKYARFNVIDVSEMMICSGELEGSTYICQGDPGDPLIFNEEQVGISSWSTGCAGKEKPAVYTSIPMLFPWIQREVESMKEGDECECSGDGFSGGINTKRMGCAQHLKQHGDQGYFCMVKGGLSCSLSTESLEYKGAAWRLCE